MHQSGVVTEPEKAHLGTHPRDVVQFSHRRRQRRRVRRVVEERFATGQQMCCRLTVGDDQHHRLRVGMATKVPLRQEQCMVQVGPLLPHPVEPDQFGHLQRLGVVAEGDQLQFITAEACGDQVVERHRCALHRGPPVLQPHRERCVDQQGDCSLTAGLGLTDLHVADVDADAVPEHRIACVQLVAILGHGAQHRVRHRAGDIPGFGVTELPFPA